MTERNEFQSRRTIERLVKFLLKAFQAKPSKRIHLTNKTLVHNIDKSWRIGSLDFYKYGEKLMESIDLPHL